VPRLDENPVGFDAGMISETLSSVRDGRRPARRHNSIASAETYAEDVGYFTLCARAFPVVSVNLEIPTLFVTVNVPVVRSVRVGFGESACVSSADQTG